MRVRLCITLGLVLLFCLGATAQAAPEASPAISAAVQLDSGWIAGETAGSLQVFRGIPYAAPPVENLRWQPPQ